MHQLKLSISQSHTNTPLNRNNPNCKWTSITLGECKITNTFWLPDGSPLQVRIDPVENLPIVVVIPIPVRTAEFANLFVALTLAGRNLTTPTLDTAENQKLVDLLAYMKANLGTYTGVSLINLLHGTCSLYDLEFKQWTRKVGELLTTPTNSTNQSTSPKNEFLIVGRKGQLGTTNHQDPNNWTREPIGNY